MANVDKLLATQEEKPIHYKYLKEFRVEQCPSFLVHRCTNHRPYLCFFWHFMNQRRRRPVRRKDGTFNYSADNYCTKYDETTGICPDGDECPFLHRTAGDTERRYHLRYYKTCMCVHDTDTRGYCVKNGHHCAFAHGIHDQRPPVYDIKELEAMQASEGGPLDMNGPNVLDKERSLMNEDPKWQDTNYVLANYKTEPCKRPPRLCRQGYACPQYHNSKDKRRSPRKYKYRSTPCPNVKHGEEWGEPANCDAGDNCQYCHTRTEQQFHPEIYKSTKCNDVQQAGYCPRSVFCAFAHVEPYMVTDDPTQKDLDGSQNALGLSEMMNSSFSIDLQKQPKEFVLMAIDNDPTIGPMEKENRKRMCLTFGLRTFGSLDSNRFTGMGSAPVNIPESSMGNLISTGILQPGTSAPVNIPGSQLASFSPTNHLFPLSDSFHGLGGGGPGSAPKISSSFTASENLLFQSHISPGLGDGFSMSPDLNRISELNSINNDMSNNSTSNNILFDGPSLQQSKQQHTFSMSPLAGGLSEVNRLRDELHTKNSQLLKFEEQVIKVNNKYEIWKNQAEETNRKVQMVEQQRDDAQRTIQQLQEKVDRLSLNATNIKMNELRGMPLQKLKTLQSKLRTELEEVEKVLYAETAAKCMKCEENPRSVTLVPCNHYVLCDICASTQRECPYCQTPISS